MTNFVAVVKADATAIESLVPLNVRQDVGRQSLDMVRGAVSMGIVTPETARDTMRQKFEDDIAQAYLSAMNLESMGVDLDAEMSKIFDNVNIHRVFTD